MRAFSGPLAGTLALLLLSASACSDGDTTDAGRTDARSDGARGDGATDAATLSLRIDPPMVTQDVPVAGPAPSITFHLYAQRPGAAEEDVTTRAMFTTRDPGFGGFTAGVLQTTLRGGSTEVVAQYMGATASAPLALRLHGDVVATGAPATLPTDFGAAPAGAPGSGPAIEYPPASAVIPANLPPLEWQWSDAVTGARGYRLHLTSASTLDVMVYTAGRELSVPADTWRAVLASAHGASLSATVEALGASQRAEGAALSIQVAPDGIDNSRVYYWQASSQTLRTIDVATATDAPLQTDSPTANSSMGCVGCHAVSRDGRRFFYSMGAGTWRYGTMRRRTDGGWSDAIAATFAPTQVGTDGAFNPAESTSRPAFLVTVSTDPAHPQVSDSSSPTGWTTGPRFTLDVRDPDTNAQLTNNLDAQIRTLPDAIGHAAQMPDWSVDGTAVVFAAHDNTRYPVRLEGDDLIAGSIVEVPVSFAGGNFTFGAPRVLVPTIATDQSGQNNFLPTFSPENSLVAFTRAQGPWPILNNSQINNITNRSGRIALVRRADGMVLDLANASGATDVMHHNSWPRWAPSVGSRYLWLAFSSDRAYGHRNAEAAHKLIWVTAIDRTGAGAGNADPSAPAFLLPGQDVTSSSISPYWTVIDPG